MKRLIEWVTKHKNEIFVSIITTMIVGVLSKLWHFFIEELPAAGNSVFSALKNRIYEIASRQTPSSPSATLIIIFIASFIGIFISMLIVYVSNTKSLKNLDKINDGIDKEKKGELSEEEKKELAKKIDKVVIKRKPKNNKMGVFCFIVLFITIIYFLVYMIYPITLWNNFELSTMQIKPYVSDSEMNLLYSKWTLMRTRQDFDDINSYILNIRQENGLIK